MNARVRCLPPHRDNHRLDLPEIYFLDLDYHHNGKKINYNYIICNVHCTLYIIYKKYIVYIVHIRTLYVDTSKLPLHHTP